MWSGKSGSFTAALGWYLGDTLNSQLRAVLLSVFLRWRTQTLLALPVGTSAQAPRAEGQLNPLSPAAIWPCWQTPPPQLRSPVKSPTHYLTLRTWFIYTSSTPLQAMVTLFDLPPWAVERQGVSVLTSFWQPRQALFMMFGELHSLSEL